MRRLIAALAVTASLAALASLAPGSPVPSPCAAAGSHRAAVVVEHGDGSLVTRCVAFDTGQITGEQLLNASGIAWSGQAFGGFGDAVCAVDGEPARYSSCPGTDSYWAVFVARAGGAWLLSNVGISTLTLGDGDAEGFRYVPSSGTPAAPPLPEGVCAAAASPETTATAGATATTTAKATAAAATARRAATASEVAAATGSGTAALPSPVDSADAAAAGTTASAAPAAAAAPAASAGTASRRDAPTPTPGPAAGLDLGLLAAALAGGGLCGLAVLRLLAPRRPTR